MNEKITKEQHELLEMAFKEKIEDIKNSFETMLLFSENTTVLTGDMFKGIAIQKDLKPIKEKPYYRKFEKRNY